MPSGLDCPCLEPHARAAVVLESNDVSDTVAGSNTRWRKLEPETTLSEEGVFNAGGVHEGLTAPKHELTLVRSG